MSGERGSRRSSAHLAAVCYGRAGWRVIPCRPTRKEPLTAHGCHDATLDEGQMAEWWNRWPAANVAIATGAASGLYVVDQDDGGAEAIAALHLPRTRTIRTPSGGAHYYFRLPAGVDLGNTCRALGPGVDTRGTGGYVLAPPSVVDGRPYVVVDPAPVALLPVAIVERLRPPRPRSAAPPTRQAPSTYGERALQAEVAAVAAASTGERNHALNRAAFNLAQLVAGGVLDEAEVRARLSDAAATAGLCEREITTTLNSAINAGRRQPRGPAQRLNTACEVRP